MPRRHLRSRAAQRGHHTGLTQRGGFTHTRMQHVCRSVLYRCVWRHKHVSASENTHQTCICIHVVSRSDDSGRNRPGPIVFQHKTLHHKTTRPKHRQQSTLGSAVQLFFSKTFVADAGGNRRYSPRVAQRDAGLFMRGCAVLGLTVASAVQRQQRLLDNRKFQAS